MEIRPQSGALKFGLFNAVMMSLNHEIYLLTTIQDITERKQAEEAFTTFGTAMRVFCFSKGKTSNTSKVIQAQQSP
jgi:isoprenylcysteine carboxyl methyltransferase (ICMT) family protein YpbQ